MDSRQTDLVHRLWDELADFDAARGEEAADHLMATLCALVGAQNAIWIGAVRLSETQPGDPVLGWRPRATRYLRLTSALAAAGREQTKSLERGSVDATTVRNVELAGSFRVNRLVDLVPQTWFDSDYYGAYYRGVGYEDAIWAGVPVNADAECYFGVFRENGRPRFSVEDSATMAFALRGLKWFHRQLMLSHGLLVASSPLTPVERDVLRGLLAGHPEKQIATALGHSYHTTHDYVATLFRKFGVNNRAALMALWLGREA